VKEPTFTGKDTSAFPRPSAALLASLGPLSNDLFVNSEQVTVTNPFAPYTATENTTGANIETNEVQPNCNAGYPIFGSVWFDFTPGVTANYTLTTAGSNFDTVLGVYTDPAAGTAAANNLTKLACKDDENTSTFTSALTLNLVAGTTYYI